MIKHATPDLPSPEAMDIIERLRADAEDHKEVADCWDLRPEDTVNWQHAKNCLEAADELARLRADLATFGKDTVATENRIIDAEFMAQELRAEIEQLRAMVNFADNLRTAQRAYMADRGNDEKGQAVAMAARHYDEARATLAGNKP